MTDAVVFRGVGKRFAASRRDPGGWVFRNVDLALPAAHTSAVIGPSGCGKTTLLQLVNAVHRADEGRVEVHGEAVPDVDVAKFRRRIGYAVQGAGLFPHLTVGGNIALLARLEGWPTNAIDRRRRELFDLVGLAENLLERYPHQLSGGQQQRVGLCRALLLRPAVLLLDEPFSAVDPIARADIYRQFESLRDHEQVTTVLVTHDIREARRLADHLVVMGQGGVRQSGPVEQVVAEPRDEFVRQLVSPAS